MKLINTLTFISAACIAATVSAGPEWIEECSGGTDDAGPLPGSAQVVGAIGGGPLAAICGRLKGPAAFLGPEAPPPPGKSGDGWSGLTIPPTDYQDMYLINIVDVFAFSATVDNGGTDFDTQLFLFGSGLGFGRLANDDEPGNAPFSRLTAFSNDGSGASLSVPGVYFLAISGSDSDPESTGGLIFNMPAGSTEISGPDGPGGTGLGSGPINNWNQNGEFGDYRIMLQGCELIPLPCTADFDGDEDVDFADLVQLLAAYGGPCGGCQEDLDGDNEVTFQDLLILLSQWGPC